MRHCLPLIKWGASEVSEVREVREVSEVREVREVSEVREVRRWLMNIMKGLCDSEIQRYNLSADNGRAIYGYQL